MWMLQIRLTAAHRALQRWHMGVVLKLWVTCIVHASLLPCSLLAIAGLFFAPAGSVFLQRGDGVWHACPAGLSVWWWGGWSVPTCPHPAQIQPAGGQSYCQTGSPIDSNTKGPLTKSNIVLSKSLQWCFDAGCVHCWKTCYTMRKLENLLCWFTPMPSKARACLLWRLVCASQ